MKKINKIKNIFTREISFLTFNSKFHAKAKYKNNNI